MFQNLYVNIKYNSFIFSFQTYAIDLCRSFCELLKDITTEGQVQALKVEYRENVKYLDLQLQASVFLQDFSQDYVIFLNMMNIEHGKKTVYLMLSITGVF